MKLEITRLEFAQLFAILLEKYEEIKSDITDLNMEINQLVNFPEKQQVYKDAKMEANKKAKDLNEFINKISKQIK